MDEVVEPGLYRRLVSRVDLAGDCWEWSGCRSKPRGYGGIQIRGRKHLTHRAMWGAFFGPIPDGECVLHACDNPPCINPWHLFLGSHADNAADRAMKNRSFRARGELNPRAIVSDAERSRGIAMFRLGWTAQRVGEFFGVSTGTVRKWCRLAGAKVGRAGRRNGRAKLTRKSMRQIAAFKEAGFSNVQIGRRIGVTDATVGNYLRGATWKT